MASIELNDKRTMSIMYGINNGVVNVTGHIKSLGIKPTCFDTHLKKIALKNPNLYNQYLEKKELNLEQFKENGKDILLAVEDMIDNGVLLDNGTIRNFDLLDWYYIYNRYFQNLTRIFMSNLLNEIDRSYGVKRVSRTRELLSRSYNDNLGSVIKTINADFIISDNTFNLSDLEKTAIINYFYRNGIPFTYDSYYCAVERVINNRENFSCINNDIHCKNNHFIYEQEDIVKFNQLNQINKCFEIKIKKRVR